MRSATVQRSGFTSRFQFAPATQSPCYPRGMTHEAGCKCAICGAAIPDPPLDYAYKLPLPVPIEGGEEFRYGVWVEVDRDTFERVVRVWNDAAAYRTLTFSGRIANAFPPFGQRTVDVLVDLATRDEKSRPFVIHSREPWLVGLLARGWTHREHLDVAQALRATVTRRH